MILLVGLGNPGDKYERHRHNIGFRAADAIADAHGFGPARNKFNSELREGFLSGPGGRTKAIILKPLTYMNDSGQAVGEAARFYKLNPDEIVVFYDELDLAPGKLRVKTGGGAAGHNGIRSIDSHLGNGFRRVRIGIGHPGEKSKVSGHVLGNFSKADQEWLSPMLDAIAAAAPFLTSDDQRFATDVAQRIAPNRPEKKKSEKAKTATPPETKADTNKAPADEARQKGPFAALGQLIGGKSDRE